MAKMSDRWSYSEGKVDWRYNKRTNCYVELDHADCPPLPPPPRAECNNSKSEQEVNRSHKRS